MQDPAAELLSAELRAPLLFGGKSRIGAVTAVTNVRYRRRPRKMPDLELMEEVYRRFHSASEGVFADRIADLSIDDLPFTDSDGCPFGKVKHLVRGDDKSGAAFDIFRLGWFSGRVWELVIIDGAYVPHVHQKIDSEFFILAGGGHLSRGRRVANLSRAHRGRCGSGGGSRVHHRPRFWRDGVSLDTE